MKVQEIIPAIRESWDTVSYPIVYACVTAGTIFFISPETWSATVSRFVEVEQVLGNPDSAKFHEAFGLLKLAPVIGLVLLVMALFVLEKALLFLGDLVPIDINSRDPERFVQKSGSGLYYISERLPHYRTPDVLQNYLEAIATNLKPELLAQVEGWRQRAERAGKNFRVTKAILIISALFSMYLVLGGASDLRLCGRVAIVSVLSLLMAAYFAVRLVKAYEQIGLAESTTYFQAVMLGASTATVDEGARAQARTLVDGWVADPEWQGWWRIRMFKFARWRKRVRKVWNERKREC